MADRHTHRIAAYLVLIKDDQVLLSKRMNTGFQDGNYSMIAGHVDPGETFSQTILREAKEEAGITITSDDLKPLHIQQHKSEDSEYIDVYFTATKWEGKIENLEPLKCGGLDWFRLDNLPENTIPYIRFVLEQVKQNTFYSEYGW